MHSFPLPDYVFSGYPGIFFFPWSSGFYPPRCYQRLLGPKSSVLSVHLPSFPTSSLRGLLFDLVSALSTDTLAQSAGLGLPRVRRMASSYAVQLHIGSVLPDIRPSSHTPTRPPFPTPYSWFAVRYVHDFCLMLPSDDPSRASPLPCWLLPSVR